MQRVLFKERFINSTFSCVAWTSLILALMLIGQGQISKDQTVIFTSESFKVSFAQLSPAFAAFEDDFLMDQSSASVQLQPKQSSHLFEKLATQQILPTPTAHIVQVEPTKRNADNNFIKLLSQFDGEKRVSEIQLGQMPLAQTSPKVQKTKEERRTLNGGELAFGSLVAMVNPIPKTKSSPRLIAPTPQSNPNKRGPNQEVHEMANKETTVASVDHYRISGGLQLTEGLAFLGSMEVSWVVGDYELQRGSINTPDATYEIEVHKLIGDVIVSLYDKNDELMGEGVLDLTQLQTSHEDIQANIQIHPIDWDEAGQVVHIDSLGTGANKPVEGAQVALYSFNEATHSSKDGSFSFYNWKKTNSRTLAIASKEGFFDSIFTLDSKSSAQVVLFENDYMESFFKYLQELGVYNVKEQGTVYGALRGIPKKEGYVVRLEKAQPVYFLPAGFATLKQGSTSSNGLFAFVGLQDGDYELIVEKNGEILDERLVVVEQGKVSPVLVDLSKVSKHLEFFDPMNPEDELSSVEMSFFDGSETRPLDQDNHTKLQLNRGQDLSIMELQGKVEVSRTLLSRHKGLQKVPLINDQKLLALANKHNMKVSDGLVIGFVKSPEAYKVSIGEEIPEKILYFNDSGQLVDSDLSSPAYGFIIGGFSPGLSSIIIESQDDNVVLGTDLIYSNHESISVTHLEILAAD